VIRRAKEKIQMKIAVIGAGPAGLAAAFDFARAGHEVVCYESGSQVGGLAGGFKAAHWDWSLEKYYHHWFQSDKEIQRLADDLGIRDKILYPEPITALYHEGKFYAFDSPLAVLKFPGVPFVDRLRFGFVGAYLRFTKNWKGLEKHTAHEWLKKYLGERAYRVLWEPMLEGKFGPEYYKQVNMAWFWARIAARTRKLGTFEGGFQAFMEAAADGIRNLGGRILLDSPVERIAAAPDGGLLVRTGQEETHFDRVLTTSSPALLAKTVPGLPSDYLERLAQLKSLGAVVLTVALDRPLGPGIYWYNLPKKEGFPFLCLVEHTFFIPPDRYGGDHLIYCGDYVPEGHRYFSMSKEELLKEFLPALARINPSFSPTWVKDSWLFRAAYAQPVPLPNHSKNIPDIQTPIPGLFWASMSHVYPWDRGTNFAVEIGREAATRVLATS
jgi:protoporphyrinogen oxidase